VEEAALPKSYRRNFWCFALDFGFFGLGMAFVSVNTVMPSFLTVLGTSSAFIGLISSLQSASWLLPQLLAARYLADKPRKKPYILGPAAAGRSLLVVLAALVWITGAAPTWLTMLAVLLVVVGFWVADGLGSVAWFDVMSSAIPPRRRGRLVGTGQVIGSSLAFLAGFVVEWLLSDRGPAFPNNYALLFLLGSAMLGCSLLAISFLVEDHGFTSARVLSWREYLPQLWNVFKQDRVFRRLILARQLSGLSSLSIPFYMTYALESLGLPSHVAGRYTSIGVLGSIFAALTFGWLNERYGSKRVILISLTLGLLVPIMALLLPALITEPSSLAWGYGLVFFCLSALMSSMMPGWMTYVLEWAPPSERPTYVGLTNTLNGITSLFATLGGLFLEWSGNNYRLLFVITALGLLVAWPLPLGLPEPRQRHSRATIE
jgi:MFS family permease